LAKKLEIFDAQIMMSNYTHLGQDGFHVYGNAQIAELAREFQCTTKDSVIVFPKVGDQVKIFWVKRASDYAITPMAMLFAQAHKVRRESNVVLGTLLKSRKLT
jgi:hypothetical protein